MRIAISNAERRWGGTLSVAASLAHGFHHRGHHVLVLCRRASPLLEAARGLPRAAVLGGRDLPMLAATRAAAAMREYRIEALLITSPRDLFQSGLAAAMLGLPVLVRWAETRATDTHWSRLAQPAVRRIASHFVANSASAARALLEGTPWLGPADVSVVLNGVPVRRFASGPSADPDTLGIAEAAEGQRLIVGCFSRLETKKGIEELLDAWPHVRDALPHARLLVVGDGAHAGRVSAAAAGDATITRLPYQPHVAPLMRACDLVVVPSREEGFGLSAAEALCAGVPVVATRVGGLPEVIRDGVDGVLVAPLDPAALAAAVIELLRDPERRAHMADAARADAGRFDVERMISSYEELLARLVATRVARTSS